MPSNTIRRAYRYRFYPTDAQAELLLRTFGCVRKVYNLALEARGTAWSTEQRHISYNETSRLLTQWKKTSELGYLNEVSCVPLQQALRHLQDGFNAFWEKHSRYPRFKSKRKSRRSAEYTRSAFRWRNGQLILAKMDAPLKIVWSRPLPEDSTPSTVTVSQDHAGRWFVSIMVDTDTVTPLPPVPHAVGIDLGITSLATLSNGEKIANPRLQKREHIRIVRSQRVLARKTPESRNWEKARRKAARVHVRIADRRRDLLHQLTTRLVRENQTVVIEDLMVKNMIKNHKLARAISDAAWSELRSMLETKCRWYGRNLVVIDRWTPTSKTCSICGVVATSMPLSARQWSCTVCGSEHDRDINAARNILAAGLAVKACGADVRPQREASFQTGGRR